MISPPPCDSLGSHCRELKLTLRVADIPEDPPAFQDAIGTWLFGHQERITFGKPYVRGTRLLTDVTVHVACKFLALDPTGNRRGAGADPERGTCTAHQMHGLVPRSSQSSTPPELQHGEGDFTLVKDQRMQRVALRPAAVERRALPVLPGENPCAGAPCRTADNQRGAACCRDLTLDVVIPADEIETEALLRSRRVPYVCKVTRVDEDIVECEAISACGYLASDDLSCTLHGLIRESGASAKPSICYDWPSYEPDSVYHPGCRLAPGKPAASPAKS